MKGFVLPPSSLIFSKTEGEGFEPSNAFRRCRFSRPMHSAALPPLLGVRFYLKQRWDLWGERAAGSKVRANIGAGSGFNG
jgi:hypothetical protein